VRLITGKAPPSAYMIYEETWIEGNQMVTKIGYGHRVHTMEGHFHLNAKSKKDKERAKEELRPELYTPIHAAALLMREIENHCIQLDQKRGIKEK